MRRPRIAAAIAVALVLGCGTREPPSPAPAPPRPTLLIGLIPERNIFHQFERYEPLAAYLSKKAGVDVKLKVLTHYGNVIENFESLNLDGAFFGSFGYALAHARLSVEVLARPESLEGPSMYRGLIVVRKDARIASVQEMKGKRLGLVARTTFAGYLFPMVHLHENGVRHPRAHFKEVYFAGSHEAVIRDVLDRKADVGGTKDAVFKELAAGDPRIERELTVVAESAPVPENALAVRSTIPAPVKEKLVAALTGMHEDAEGAEVLKKFRARRFIRTTDDDYAPMLKYAQAIGLDLRTCCLANER